MGNDSKLQAALNGLCPRCRQGKIFEKPFYSLTGFDKMYEFCPHCGLRYEVEPGYFYGAMFVSYAISAGVALVIGFMLFYLANDPDGWLYVAVVAPVMVIIAPINFRISRVIWLHYVSGIKYQPGL
ncbi:DUF983 domain-containing protein [Fibrisoma montanum]|uniref:DUF983 domain-containing protein n=1 Tax=Fibrisoma montanum TaxID=2305895 RepID=A0A418MJM5_9BACT|nr:DUF983 domain-containing protein [Fibrisoma montanum]RIV27607.1 DUF983 domain-containing protein [Fibrisoma montanum]